MICQCICKCPEEASGDNFRVPELCVACSLCDAMGSDRHGLPYVAPVYKPLEPEVPITNAQKDAAIDSAAADMLGI